MKRKSKDMLDRQYTVTFTRDDKKSRNEGFK